MNYRLTIKSLSLIGLFLVLLGFIAVYITWQKTADAESYSESVLDQETNMIHPPHPFLVAYAEHDNAILIDIRTPEEYSSGYIPGAINIDYYDPLFTHAVRQAAGDKTVFIYCRSGNRSSEAYRRLTDQGLLVEEMRGGIRSYRGELVKE